MKRDGIQHHIDSLAPLLLFGVFSVCVLAVLLTGAQACRRLTGREGESYERRTAVQYVATRVRQSDSLDGVAVEDFQGVPALVLREKGGCAIRVYCYDGYLRELYTDREDLMVPGEGKRILEVRDLELSLEEGLLTAVITDGTGEETTLHLSLRSGEEGGG